MRRAVSLLGASFLFMMVAILGACAGGYCEHALLVSLENAVSRGGAFVVLGLVTARRYNFIGTAVSIWGVFVTVVLTAMGITA